MISPKEELKQRLEIVRHDACRARRVARGMGVEDQCRLIAYAEELEGEARQLEKDVARAG